MTENWHQLTEGKIFERLATNPSGLRPDEVEKRQLYGKHLGHELILELRNDVNENS